MNIKFAVTTVAAVILLGGCANNMQDDLGAYFGTATRHKFAVQVIDPATHNQNPVDRRRRGGGGGHGYRYLEIGERSLVG